VRPAIVTVKILRDDSTKDQKEQTRSRRSRKCKRHGLGLAYFYRSEWGSELHFLNAVHTN
jgi:hypothetical protein